MTTQVYSLSICGRATLNLHSLNNEGGEGNQIQTRMVDIVGSDGRLYNVNAISGDMFKHIQAEHLYHTGRGQLPLCKACQQFDANRISADPDFREFLKGKTKPTQVEVLNRLIQTCAMDDLEGNLITEGGFSTPRKSVVEFGWVVGVPEVTRSDQYFHVKYVPDRREKPTDKEEREGNLGQSIFHRPASSGVYAAIAHAEIVRIGYNDISQNYVLDTIARQARYKALLESLIYTFVEPNGAMRNTQLPHMVNFEGVVSYTTAILPAPTVSPLNENYREDIEGVSEALGKLHPEAITVKRFNSLAEYAGILQELIASSEPCQLNL
ncbi:MAG: DevR family CRISPR-associated autoregulator [Chloroflexi bacterium]|nr:DevR family CRISPR-associated autoregulator [Chloroflexota bacterium]